MQCDACHKKQATYDFSMTLAIVGINGERVKMVQFCLCDDCEQLTRQFLAKDEYQRHRVALRLVEDPASPPPVIFWKPRPPKLTPLP
ncbi:MAG: hypothetical protein EHM70_00460 [Chloroflexota bacterium]|nr:MAG: hypothetical protein EHM70_00460 [Chloroflexota bacterium]